MKNQIGQLFPFSLAGVCVGLPGPRGSDAKKPLTRRDVVTQVSGCDALALGLYDGVASLESLRPHGVIDR